MYQKIYLSRRQTKSMSIDHPIGDPTGGAAYREMRDPVSAAVMVGGQLIGGAISGNAAASAAAKQSKAAQEASAAQRAMAERNAVNLQDVASRQMTNLGSIYGQSQAYTQPFITTGTNAAAKLNELVSSGYFSQPFTAADLKSNLAPNYEFMLNQGLGATKQALNVGGGGSNIARGATKFAEDYASNAYQNAFNNWQAQRSNIFNTLSGIAGIGTAGTGQAINAGNVYGYTGTGLTTGVGKNIADLLTGGAAATAAGITGSAQAEAAGDVGVANALSGGVSSAGQTYALSQLLKPKTGSPLQNAQSAMNQYGAENVYGFGGQGVVPSSVADYAF
jgi:hypothetical protein